MQVDWNDSPMGSELRNAALSQGEGPIRVSREIFNLVTTSIIWLIHWKLEDGMSFNMMHWPHICRLIWVCLKIE